MNKTLGLFIICFLAPALTAFLALKFDWLEPAQTNFGHFVENEQKIEKWPAESQLKWSLVTLSEEVCTQHCETRKKLIKNVFDVLGKHNLYVGAFSLSSSQQALQLTNLTAHENAVTQLENQTLAIESDAIYLVDHHGLIVLEYPVNYQLQSDNNMKRGLIKDLKKLLNYSRSRA